MSPGNGTPPVNLILGANHRLGHALCRELYRDGGRLIVADADPASGEAVCQRLGWQGAVASYRYLSPEQPGGEAALASDIEAVYGRLDLVVSFQPPANHPVNWFALGPGNARRLLAPSIEQRLRLLAALRPLLARSPHPRLAHVTLGRPTSARHAVDRLWNDLLAADWRNTGVRTLSLETEIRHSDWESIHLRSIERDLARLRALLDVEAAGTEH